MSGPKTSGYVLTEEERRRIQEQERIWRETKAEQARYKSLHRKNGDSAARIFPVIRELNTLCREAGKGETELGIIKEQYDALTQKVNDRKGEIWHLSLEELRKRNDHQVSLGIKIRDLYRESLRLKEKIAEEYDRESFQTISEGFRLSFKGLGQDRRIRQNPTVIKINEALKRIRDIELPPELEEEYKVLQKRADHITDADFLENLCSMQVYPFVRRCEYYRDHLEEYESLAVQYHCLAERAGEEEEPVSFSQEAMGFLKNEIDRLSQILLDREEQACISQAIDEAMVEMGYELVGERTVTKRNGKKFRNGLYLLEEGTAVNVTYSDSGQISMELGGLDTVDRTPTESEAEELADHMRAFCSDYRELEKKLASKGVQSRRISALPPEPEYAQVFNTGEYELKRPLSNYREERKKKKGSAGTKMYREG